jgi:hypothetical protein
VPVYGPVGIRHGGGESAIRALVWNVGTCHSDEKGEIQGKKTKYESTDAEYRDGATCSSDEGAVMVLEQRGCPIWLGTIQQLATGGLY